MLRCPLCADEVIPAEYRETAEALFSPACSAQALPVATQTMAAATSAARVNFFILKSPHTY